MRKVGAENPRKTHTFPLRIADRPAVSAGNCMFFRQFAAKCSKRFVDNCRRPSRRGVSRNWITAYSKKDLIGRPSRRGVSGVSRNDGAYDEEGNAHADPICVAEYFNGEDF